MERGEIENNCFNYLKSIVISNNDIFYGSSIKDDILIKQIFQTAKPNPDLSKFPDFIFDSGFIEHFEVTSSYLSKKGSKMKREQDKLQKNAEVKEKELEAQMNESPCYEGKTITTDKWHSKHSYDNFCLSFKRNREHHINSLDNYAGDKSIGVFMLQYNDSALVLDSVFPDLKTEIYYGDLLKKPEYCGYRLTHDEFILDYIYQFKDKIKYVMFFNNDWFHGRKCEIICVENIPEILKIIKGKYSFHSAMVGTAHMTYGVSIPVSNL